MGSESLVLRCSHCGAFNRVPSPRVDEAPGCGRCHQTLATDGAPQDASGEGFSRAINASPVPVVVDFWAPWCGPCKVAGPIFDQVVRARRGRVVGLKLNTEADPQTGAAWDVRGIPTFIVFFRGTVVARVSGALPAAELARWLDGALESPAHAAT